MNNENVNIGEKFKEAFQNYEIAPSPEIWTNIENSIHSGFSIYGKKLTVFKAAIYITVASAIIIGSIVGFQKINTVKKQNTQKLITNNNSTFVSTSIEVVNNSEIKNPILDTQKPEYSPSSNTQTSVKPNIREKVENINNGVETETIYPITINTLNNQNGKAIELNSLNTLSDKTIEIKEPTNENFNSVKSPIDSGFVVNFSSDPTICFGEDAILEVNCRDCSFEWENGSTNSKIRVKPLQNSEYKVVVSNSKGEKKYHTFNVIIDKECTAVFVPTAFTPNGDGSNDLFIAQGLGIREFYMQIANRAGLVVFESNEINQGWDANNILDITSTEVYIFFIKYVDAKGVHHLQKGQVTLIR
jgi:gliding motility-associated-like protein